MELHPHTHTYVMF